MANLVQSQDHIAGGVQPWHIRSLMTIDHHATVFAGLGAKLGCKFGMNVRPERWIYGIEGFAP